MTSVLLIYPYFKPQRDRSVFRFPPLGISYIASSLMADGYDVQLMDCTFLKRETALQKAMDLKAEVVGIYCMVTMVEDCFWFAKQLRGCSRLMVAGGPLPTCNPHQFLEHFDVVVCGEGEGTMKDLLRAYDENTDMRWVEGIVFKIGSEMEGIEEQQIYTAKQRTFIQNLDDLPFPARNLLPNESYIRHGRQKSRFSITTVMSTRGCPYHCEFCSNVVFGGSYRERFPMNVVDEIEQVLGLGYDRISFSDDVFTLNRKRLLMICNEINRRGLKFQWECLGRVDALDYPTAVEMKNAGCFRIFFGIESGSERILSQMNKGITCQQARVAVEIAHQAGIQAGAFFILCYPGDTNDTVLETLHFATTLPLDYLGLTMPYPLPGTKLYERVKHQIHTIWNPSSNWLGNHVLIFNGDFSETKMWFGIMKGQIQFIINKHSGRLAPILMRLFEKPTDILFRLLK